MIIKQEETSPITDLFDKLKLNVAFHGIEEQSTSVGLDSDLLKEYATGTITLLKDFIKGIETIEKELTKQKNKAAFNEKLFGGDY